MPPQSASEGGLPPWSRVWSYVEVADVEIELMWLGSGRVSIGVWPKVAEASVMLLSMAAMCLLTESLCLFEAEKLVISASFEAAVVDESWNFCYVNL